MPPYPLTVQVQTSYQFCPLMCLPMDEPSKDLAYFPVPAHDVLPAGGRVDPTAAPEATRVTSITPWRQPGLDTHIFILYVSFRFI